MALAVREALQLPEPEAVREEEGVRDLLPVPEELAERVLEELLLLLLLGELVGAGVRDPEALSVAEPVRELLGV